MPPAMSSELRPPVDDAHRDRHEDDEDDADEQRVQQLGARSPPPPPPIRAEDRRRATVITSMPVATCSAWTVTATATVPRRPFAQSARQPAADRRSPTIAASSAAMSS